MKPSRWRSFLHGRQVCRGASVPMPCLVAGPRAIAARALSPLAGGCLPPPHCFDYITRKYERMTVGTYRKVFTDDDAALERVNGKRRRLRCVKTGLAGYVARMVRQLVAESVNSSFGFELAHTPCHLSFTYKSAILVNRNPQHLLVENFAERRGSRANLWRVAVDALVICSL